MEKENGKSSTLYIQNLIEKGVMLPVFKRNFFRVCDGVIPVNILRVRRNIGEDTVFYIVVAALVL
jgi:hypothetical protein